MTTALSFQTAAFPPPRSDQLSGQEFRRPNIAGDQRESLGLQDAKTTVRTLAWTSAPRQDSRGSQRDVQVSTPAGPCDFHLRCCLAQSQANLGVCRAESTTPMGRMKPRPDDVTPEEQTTVAIGTSPAASPRHASSSARRMNASCMHDYHAARRNDRAGCRRCECARCGCGCGGAVITRTTAGGTSEVGPGLQTPPKSDTCAMPSTRRERWSTGSETAGCGRISPSPRRKPAGHRRRSVDEVRCRPMNKAPRA